MKIENKNRNSFFILFTQKTFFGTIFGNNKVSNEQKNIILFLAYKTTKTTHNINNFIISTMQTTKICVFILLFALSFFSISTAQAQANFSTKINTSLNEDGINVVKTTVFIKQTSNNGVLFTANSICDLTKITRLVVINEVDYIITNPFILSQQFSNTTTTDIDAIAVTEETTIFPLIED